MAITINDVANEAGVSKSTVSKVLNGWTTISAETTSRVNEAIRKLNYIPNSRAVCFARQTTKNIVYLTNLGKAAAYYNPHMFDIMCGVHHQLSECNFTLSLVDTSEEAFPGERALMEIKSHSSDGLIVHGSAINEELADLLEKIPTEGKSTINIIIGSSYGIAESLKKQADLRLSMSKMTFPHQLARVMVMEQIYRGFMINSGKKYHK